MEMKRERERAHLQNKMMTTGKSEGDEEDRLRLCCSFELRKGDPMRERPSRPDALSHRKPQKSYIYISFSL